MPLHPQAVEFLEAYARLKMPPFETTPVGETRSLLNAAIGVLPDCPTLAAINDVNIPGPGGPLRIRIYRPKLVVNRGACLYFHGGGWVLNSIDTHDDFVRRLTDAAGCVCVSVDYRLAPEHAWPAAADDAYAALQWVAANAATWDIDPSRLAVAGDSAGGNLAAVCAILARDAGAPALAFQLLAYPRTAHAEDAPSHAAFGDGFLLTRATILWFHAHYRSRDDDRYDWRYAPLLCADLARLPPALVVVGEFDPLRDEGIAYAARLRDAGVPVRLHDCRGMVHGFFSLGGVAAAARAALSEAAHALRAALAGPG